MGVCCSVVLVHGGLCLRSLWETLPSVLLLLLVFMCSALAKSLLGEHTSPNEEFTSDSLQLVLLGRGWFSSEELF